MTAHPTERLSAYLDDELAQAARSEIDAHLDACETCRVLIADLHALRASAAAWSDAPAEPARDLWPGIAARLSGPRVTVADPRSLESPAAGRRGPATVIAATPWYRRRWSVGVPELALAASLAAAVAGVSVMRRAPIDTPPSLATPPVVAEVEVVGSPETGVVPVSFADAQYNAAVGDLERVLLEQRDRLDPRTVIVLERNLRVIDDAIREAREALATDPANTLLNTHLASARRRKLDLLRRATLITEAN